MAINPNGGQYIPGNLRTDTINGIELYQALLTQASTAAPVATVLHNDLDGTPVWARTSAGLYTLTLTGAFLAATLIQITPDSPAVTVTAVRTSANVITVKVWDTTGTPALADDKLAGTSIEIKVFN